MVPEADFLGVEYMQPPPDLTMWMPEVEWLGQLDLFGTDFTPTIDQTFEGAIVYDNSTSIRTRDGMAGTPNSGVEADPARRRSTVMQQQSPYEHEGITLDERNVDLAASPHEPYTSNVVIPDRLSGAARDRIFQLVSKTAKSQITVYSFPSADCLDRLIKVGIAKRTETDAWIHPHTFTSESARPEYLTALVAAGCICFGIPSVNRTGLVLQEIVRVALNNLQDNSAIRDLQYLQASMLWLDIGAFCGYTRKMEIAESSLQNLVTGLRRAGRLDHVRYPAVIPSADDSVEALDEKWRSWVELESYKRLVYHVWEHDIDMTMVKHRQPLISYAELTLPLPAPRSLWLAPSAGKRRTRYLSDDNLHTAKLPSLRILLQDESVILSRSAYLHGLAAQIWEYNQQSVLLDHLSVPSSQLWSRSRQQRLYQCLQRPEFLLEKSPAVASLFHQFLQMYLHVNLDTITRFSGKCGEEEAHRAYTHLQTWSQTKEARIAICHAGQALRAARSIPSYQNRGPDSFIVYHAIMVLWTYSMMMRDRAKRTGTSTPIRGQSQMQVNMVQSANVVFLDDPPSVNQSAVDAFILLNTATPSLNINSAHSKSNPDAENPDWREVCDLRFPSQVMKAFVY
ncbi:hypothetical protein BCR34DRAFT_627710 [Clohesyomyces aquaticus]|uniref:Xylanolytic transcriptional activator regulatory domain-containing protein n=1 Tax=Clohesyomyces aquaticus TaxID=1231657 RepID=A0A1Y1YVS8_9PLEO|nr:hypothetical protein BCR34DRAFT_627710 [Clohesyomyces aquaticus]